MTEKEKYTTFVVYNIKKKFKDHLNLENILFKTVVDDIRLSKITYSKLGTISLEILSTNLTHPALPVSRKQNKFEWQFKII